MHVDSKKLCLFLLDFSAGDDGGFYVREGST